MSDFLKKRVFACCFDSDLGRLGRTHKQRSWELSLTLPLEEHGHLRGCRDSDVGKFQWETERSGRTDKRLEVVNKILYENGRNMFCRWLPC
jgi:hypothetical protein